MSDTVSSAQKWKVRVHTSGRAGLKFLGTVQLVS
jgi:hypothetical protein